VLFPGQVLPLHIFEPRYRKMISQCLDRQQPFGVVLAQEDDETNESARPYQVGTTARITQVERLDGGRFNIVTVGELRFRLLTMRETEAGYLQGVASLWPWSPSDESAAHALTGHVRDRLKRYLGLLAQVANLALQKPSEDLPEQPDALACLTAIALQIEPVEKQDLLISPSIEALLNKEIVLLKREARMLQVMLGSLGRPTGDTPIVFSAN
jgi:Lon protease-like protein